MLAANGNRTTTTTTRRALAGAVLVDLAVSPLFAWDVFTDALRRELDVGDAVLAGVFSSGLLAFVLGVLVGGRLADEISPRRLTLVTLLGTTAGLLGSATASSPLVLLLSFGVLLGGGSGLGYVTAVRVAGTLTAGRGLALGVVVSAYAIGSAVLAPVASALLDTVGRAWTFVVLAGALAVALVIAAALLPGGRVTPTAPGSRPRRHFSPWRRPRRAVVALWLAFGLGSAPTLAAFAAAGDLAGDAGSAAVAVTLLNLGNVTGRLVAGPASDRVGRPVALHVAAGLLLVCCLALGAGVSGRLALVGLVLLGTQYGALSTLIPAATADVVPAERFGTTYGRVFTGWGVAGLCAPVGAAALADRVGYDGVYRMFLVVAALAWACVGIHVRLTRRRSG